jgi:PilZ domain-containing protein
MSSPIGHPCTLLIGSEPLLAAWNARAGNTSQVIPVVHTDVPQALEAIGTKLPDVVVIEQAVATTGPGSTLMARLHTERYTRGIDVRLLPPERAADLMSSEPGDVHPQVWLTVLANPLPARPMRRAPRMRPEENEEALVDGSPVMLIDLSNSGAQVRSSIVLRPQQRVKFVLSAQRGSVKTSGVVAWSTFEMAPTPRYRAGIAFTDAIPNLVGNTPSA